MIGNIKNYFPGGNTPMGFFSYYEEALNRTSAKRCYLLKGGPGTGKSTLMKKVARYFSGKGENVDYLWCSSDPESLDAVILKDRKTAIVDGTAPHIMDPKYPGAVDEIVNLGSCWEKTGLCNNRENIIECSKSISDKYEIAYGYLKSAAAKQKAMHVFVEEKPFVSDAYLNIFETIKTLKKEKRMGKNKNMFATAITPFGVIDHLNSLASGLNKIFLLRVPVGVECNKVIENAGEMLLNAGYNTETYFCPIRPTDKREHLISEEAGIGIFTCNDYHGSELFDHGAYAHTIRPVAYKYFDDKNYFDLKVSADSDITACIEVLAEAKSAHDKLENYYIPHINHRRLNNITEELIAEIEHG